MVTSDHPDDAQGVGPSPPEYPPSYSPELRDYLKARAVPADVARARGYKDLLKGKPGKSSDDQNFAVTYGFPQARGGFLIPLHPLSDGEPKYQLRHLPHDTGAPQRFRTPAGQANCLATSPLTRAELGKGKEAIVIAEGVTRVDALAGYGVPAVGILGAWNWRGRNDLGGVTALPDWDEMAIKGNRFVLAFDGDILTNSAVANAARRLKRFLLGRGADMVRVLAVPDGLGLDDWIARERFADKVSLITTLHAHAPGGGVEEAILATPGRPDDDKILDHSYAGLETALERLDIGVRYNKRSAHTEYKYDASKSGSRWIEANDRESANILAQIEESFVYQKENGSFARYQIRPGVFHDRLQKVLWANEIDPFAAWLESLPAWDKTTRLDKLFIDCLGVEDTELARHAPRFLIAAARRTYGEFKHDWIPMLIGAQGRAKSTFVRLLLPQDDEFLPWYVDGVTLTGNAKEMQEQAGSAVLVEVSEMAASRNADVHRLKSLLSQTSASFRPAYGRQAERFVRRFVLIGTLNPDDYAALPTDSSGYRRYVPLFVDDSTTTYEKVEAFLTANRIQLWAEARDRAKAKEATQLTPELEQRASQIASQLAAHDELDEIAELMTLKYAGALHAERTLDELLVEFELADKEHPDRTALSLYKLMGGKLRRLGWYRRRQQEAGVRRSCWVPPKQVPDGLLDKVETGNEKPKALHWGRPGPGVPQCSVCKYSHEHPDQTGELRAGGQYHCADKEGCQRRAEHLRLQNT